MVKVHSGDTVKLYTDDGETYLVWNKSEGKLTITLSDGTQFVADDFYMMAASPKKE